MDPEELEAHLAGILEHAWVNLHDVPHDAICTQLPVRMLRGRKNTPDVDMIGYIDSVSRVSRTLGEKPSEVASVRVKWPHLGGKQLIYPFQEFEFLEVLL